MKKFFYASCITMMLPLASFAQLKFNIPTSVSAELKDSETINESYFFNNAAADSGLTMDFKPSVQVGAIMHAYAEMAQSPTAAGADDEGEWKRNFALYRARILVGVNLSPKGTFFMETDIPNQIGISAAGESKSMKVSPIILDFQYEHVFSKHFSIIAGKQLVSNNRNGLQGAASLMANDFTHYQYPYNMFESSPLQGNFGRDIGINTRGFLLKDDRLEYRLGAFTGRNFEGSSPVRVVGRLQYSFLDPEKDFYYAGTKLGTGKTLTLAGGVDAQGDYINLNIDGYLDVPVGETGAVTANAAFAYMDGGSGDAEKSFSKLIPKQTVQFLELGYYFKKLKIQPWIKYENQMVNEGAAFYGLPADIPSEEVDNQNLLSSNQRVGGGVNYWFNGYNTNLRVSYTQAFYGRMNEAGDDVEKASAGQVWLQLQVFFF